jgi:transcriptional regulator with XRE-family HTH domain
MGKLGTTIREQRQKRDIKVYKLAKTIGVHPTYVTYIEKHDRLPSLEVIAKLEKALDIDLKELYFKEKHPGITVYLDSSVLLGIASSQEKWLLSKLNDYYHTGKKSDIHELAALYLDKFMPNQKNNKEMVNGLTQRLLNLRNEFEKYYKRQASELKGILNLTTSATLK